MHWSGCDAVANMVFIAAVVIVFHRVWSVLWVLLGLDQAASKAIDLISRYGNWLFAVAVIIGAWWLFWK